jgi:hypothetical protein
MARNTSGLKRGGPGRPKGAPNRATRDIREFSRETLERPEYIHSLRQRIDEGKAPHMETLLAHYAYGKPKDTLVVEDAPPPLVVVLSHEPDRH